LKKIKEKTSTKASCAAKASNLFGAVTNGRFVSWESLLKKKLKRGI